MKRNFVMIFALAAMAAGMCLPSAAVAVCDEEDTVNLFGARIERCWRHFGPGTWLIEARAYWLDGSFLCSRQYTYVGTRGDQKDIPSLRYIFDSNSNNYIDCAENPQPPYDPSDCNMPKGPNRHPLPE